MDPRDDDIQFDFFDDEPATTEAQPPPSRVRLPRRGGRGTGMRRPSRNLTPILRLAVVIVVLLVLFVIFGLLIQSCGTSKHDSYASYMNDVAKIAHSSQEDGAAVANALTTPGAKASSLAGTLRGIADQERQNVAQAKRLDPPGPLRPESLQLVESLQLRISGVTGIARTLDELTKTTKTADAASVLSAQADRLVASDVVWSDLFKVPAAEEMARQGVTGVEPPDSTFVQNRGLFNEASLTSTLQRLQGASTSGGKVTGLHGTNIVSTKWSPGGHTLSTTEENFVTATPDLSFAVTIKNSGDSQEVGVKVTLTVQQNPAIVKTKSIPVINQGQEKTVTFSDLGAVKFARKEQVLVDVKPVEGEVNTSNNKATYPVIFSLG
ncbi:MAG TPA: CARDB domain-containing protein [Gaiellaceae bacterium]|nr:CARDB domain-containing protein [Gaiellaceae bacterium]